MQLIMMKFLVRRQRSTLRWTVAYVWGGGRGRGSPKKAAVFSPLPLGFRTPKITNASSSSSGRRYVGSSLGSSSATLGRACFPGSRGESYRWTPNRCVGNLVTRQLCCFLLPPPPNPSVPVVESQGLCCRATPDFRFPQWSFEGNKTLPPRQTAAGSGESSGSSASKTPLSLPGGSERARLVQNL